MQVGGGQKVGEHGREEVVGQCRGRQSRRSPHHPPVVCVSGSGPASKGSWPQEGDGAGWRGEGGGGSTIPMPIPITVSNHTHSRGEGGRHGGDIAGATGTQSECLKPTNDFTGSEVRTAKKNTDEHKRRICGRFGEIYKFFV